MQAHICQPLVALLSSTDTDTSDWEFPWLIAVIAFSVGLTVTLLITAFVQRRSVQRLRASLVERDRLLSRVAHDIRNPLAVVHSCRDLLQMQTAQRTEVANLLQTSTSQIAYLADQLLTVARLDHHQQPTLSTVVVENLVNYLAYMISLRLEDSSVRFSTAFSPHAPPTVSCDSELLNELISNLLDNAAKYTERGHIQLRYSVLNGHPCFEVVDTGIGMSREFQEQAFEDFRRSPRAHKHAGLGIGLAVSRRIAAKLGAKIELESELGFGTCVRVLLPKQRVAPPATCREMDSSVRIAVVDDDPQLLQASVRLLRSSGWLARGYHPYGVNDTIARFDPNVVLVDVDVHGMRDDEVVAELRGQLGSSVQLIMLVSEAGHSNSEWHVLGPQFDAVVEKRRLLPQLGALLGSKAPAAIEIVGESVAHADQL